MKTFLSFILSALLLVSLFVVPVFAQTSGYEGGTSGGGSDSSSGSTSTNEASGFSSESGPTAQSMDTQTNRGFVGAEAPSGFVGVDEVYGSFSSNSSQNSSRRITTATRSTTRTTTAARRTTAAGGIAGRTANSISGQSVRSAASMEFDFTPVSSAGRLTAVQTRLTRIPGIQPEQVSLKNSPTGTTAVLTGTVKTSQERKVAKQLLLLEPGINAVDNRLEIR